MSGIKGMRAKLLNSPQRAAEWRASVRIAMIRNRLTQHFLGKIELTNTQLKAAEILISKTLPNMATVEHSGAVDLNYVAQVPEVAENSEQWTKQLAPRLNS